MNKLFPTYEVGSLPKLTARVKVVKQQHLSSDDINEVKALAKRFSLEADEVIGLLIYLDQQQIKPTLEQEAVLADFNSLLYLRLQEALGLDFVYDGEARRAEMYQHVATRVEGFEKLPEMVRSRGPDSWRMAVCIAEPKLKEGSLDKLIAEEFNFAKANTRKNIKVPIDDPYMIAVMSDNRYYLEKLNPGYTNNPHGLRYQAKRSFTLALARNVIRPQIEEIVRNGAQWIQLDIPAATLDIGHIPIMVEGVNSVVDGIENVKFSLHICYPRRVSLTEKSGYELLFPNILDLNPVVNHISLELANVDNYEKDLAVFRKYRDERAFELGIGVVDITLERQQRNVIETSEIVRDRIVMATRILGDSGLVYVAPDCGLRQLSLDRSLKIYDTLVKGAELARKG